MFVYVLLLASLELCAAYQFSERKKKFGHFLQTAFFVLGNLAFAFPWIYGDLHFPFCKTVFPASE